MTRRECRGSRRALERCVAWACFVGARVLVTCRVHKLKCFMRDPSRIFAGHIVASRRSRRHWGRRPAKRDGDKRGRMCRLLAHACCASTAPMLRSDG